MKLLTAILTSFIMLAPPAYADANIGSEIPHALELEDQHGNYQNFEALKGKKGLVLFFVRSAEWCPYCQKQLVEINTNADQITALGYNIVSVSYDEIQKLNKFTKKHEIKYPMLSDPQSEAIKSFGILNERMKEGTRHYGIPNPTIYIINKDKKIQTILSEDGYKSRPPTSKIIEEIKKLDLD